MDVCLGQPVNTFVIMARECTRALARDRAAERPGLASALVSLEERARVELRIGLMQAAVWLASLRSGLAALLLRRPCQEAVVGDKQRKSARRFLQLQA